MNEQDGKFKLALGPVEAAKALGIGRTLLFELLQSGDLRSFTIGSRRLIRISDLEEFARDCELAQRQGAR
ncbi:MAG: helix-turn-helix domain-containing protein [Holophagaceae bacterium]|nr:helix-turn-helix domain-containing protein [Holophagaceae bacterium]